MSLLSVISIKITCVMSAIKSKKSRESGEKTVEAEVVLEVEAEKSKLVDYKSSSFLSSQDSRPQDDNFSMSRSEDLANSEVYGPRSPRSATGLSVAFPGECKVTESTKDITGQEFTPSSSEPAWSQNPPVNVPFSSSAPGSLSVDKVTEESGHDPNNNDPSKVPPPASALPGESSQTSFQYMEDAQRLEPSQDPQPFSGPAYHYITSSSSQEVVLDASNLADVRVIRCLQGHSPTSSEFREKMEIEGMEAEAEIEAEARSKINDDVYVPPNQLALLSSGSRASSDFGPSGKRPRSETWKKFSLKGATAISPPPGPLSVRITSALGRSNHSGPVLELTKNGEAGFIPNDFPWDEPDLVADPDPVPSLLGESRFMSVKELASNTTEEFRTVVRNELVPFLLLVKDGDGQLYIPTPSFFDLAMTRMEIHVLVKYPHLRSFFWSCSKWMGCGIVELSSEEGLEEWRKALVDLPLESSLKADTFPKDSLLMGPDVTALLKEAHLEYDIKWMSHCLVYRNKQLKGNVRVVCSKQYQAHDITRLSVSMNGWQMIYLAGDCVFMESLSRFPVTHRFEVGPSSVILRGGIRKPGFLSDQSRAQFTWLAPSLSLQPIQGVLPSSSDGPSSSSVLARSSSSSSTSPPSKESKPEEVPTIKKAVSRKNSSAKKKSPAPIPSAPGTAAAVVSSKPKNRSQRLKARVARTKSCC